MEPELIPLSEDTPLELDHPREVLVDRGEVYDWLEPTRIAPRERRVVNVHIRVGAGAEGRMVRVFHVPKTARLTILHHIEVAEAGSWRGLICVRGEGEVRVRRVAELNGEHAQAELTCLGLGEHEARLNVADEIFVHANHGRAQITMQTALSDQATSALRARIVVDQHVRGSDSSEELKQWLLSEGARGQAIPELEVHTDELKARHAASVTAPLQEALWYVDSRGLPPAQARQLLLEGFFGSGLQTLPEASRALAMKTLMNAYA